MLFELFSLCDGYNSWLLSVVFVVERLGRAIHQPGNNYATKLIFKTCLLVCIHCHQYCQYHKSVRTGDPAPPGLPSDYDHQLPSRTCVSILECPD